MQYNERAYYLVKSECRYQQPSPTVIDTILPILAPKSFLHLKANKNAAIKKMRE